MEALIITHGSTPKCTSFEYRAHVTGNGWLPWVKNGQIAGTTGQSLRMEAIEIMVVPTGSDCSTPAYAPAFWNDGGTVQRNNNCYNYSSNTRTDSFAQPGRASGNMYSSLTCSEVSSGAISDGMEPTSATSVSPVGKTKIALVVAPGIDYHWYRQDSDGKWSHKPGGTKATNLDNSGKVITNPETANRGSYTSFCGYFFVCSNINQGQAKATIR